ncbi:MAG: ATP-dependent zinc metalloprotease FtsH [Chloroflexi bacterium]|nr:ATP-dependent zinc metalloprotease FtsH [Chloroflexota bacterium]
MESKQPNTPKKQQPSRLSTLGWWIILLALLAWNFWAFKPNTQAVANIYYSTLLDQVRAGNVKSVQIQGNQITGQFAQPIPWPAPSTGATPNAAASPQPAKPSPTQYQDFSTTFPDVVGDPSFMPLLQAHNVVVSVQPVSTPWLLDLLINALPFLLLIGFFIWMGRSASQQQSGIFNFARSKARQYTADRPEVTFDDVAGADEAKNDLQEVVDFLKNPKKYYEIGARIPRGVLLVGPPGTGKTLLARAVSGEAHVPFFSISASEFVEMFVGVGASRVRDLFEKAKAAAPAIVFVDELDAVGRRRGAGLGTVNDEREQTLNQLLVEMDGFDERHEVIILAATNRPDVLDPAILRPGRFDREVAVPLPDRKGREGILKIHTRSLNLAPDVDLEHQARITTGMSGADLANLANEAALNAARHDRKQVTEEDFEQAQDKILLGAVRPLVLEPSARRVVAYHEAGHALVAWLTAAADTVNKITIVPRGRALGVTEQMPSDDMYNYSKTYLLARLAVMLGGRTSEEIACGDITTGAENDLVQATRLARRMVTRWGMGVLGPVAYQADEQQPFLGYELAQGRDYSEATAARVDADVQQLLEDQHEVVTRLLNRERDKLDKLVDALLQEETVERKEIERLLGSRPLPEEPVVKPELA